MRLRKHVDAQAVKRFKR